MSAWPETAHDGEHHGTDLCCPRVKPQWQKVNDLILLLQTVAPPQLDAPDPADRKAASKVFFLLRTAIFFPLLSDSEKQSLMELLGIGVDIKHAMRSKELHTHEAFESSLAKLEVMWLDAKDKILKSGLEEKLTDVQREILELEYLTPLAES
jgi:hypothetical protein